MPSPLAGLAIGAGVASLSFAANAVFVAVSYSVGALRFEAAGGAQKKGLGRLELRILERSRKVGAFCVLGIRLFLMLAVFGIFKSLTSALALAGIDAGFWISCACAGLSVAGALFVQYAFCDLPVAARSARSPAPTLRRFSRPFMLFYVAAWPFEAMARALAAKVFGRKISEEGASFDHIDVLVKLGAEEEESDELTPYTKKLVRNSIRLAELDITDVMVPRNAVKYFDIRDSAGENLELARECGHTRYPLCDGNLDNCLGIVHIKDIFRAMNSGGSPDLMALKRGIIRVKHDDSLLDALSKLRKYELHMAFVEDEFGGIIGILTLDGILEEIVGQIKEEYDDQSNSIIRTGKNTYKVSGLAAIHNVEDFLDVDFSNDEVSTFGGLVTQMLGRFPEKGEKLFLPEIGMRITVDDVAARRVVECSVELVSRADAKLRP